MNGLRKGLVLAALTAGVLLSARWTLRAQERTPANGVIPTPKGRVIAIPPAEKPAVTLSVQDALEKPFDFPFGTPTRLEDVCRHLRMTLNASVVLDRAALERQDVRSDDSVELELTGVRLKTGLALLLDQVGLSYRVVPADNLLILTDEQGADDTTKRVLAELKSLHRDLHTVQDSVDELRAALGLEDGPKMRKPTIIEEMPDDPAEKKAAPTPPARPRS